MLPFTFSRYMPSDSDPVPSTSPPLNVRVATLLPLTSAIVYVTVTGPPAAPNCVNSNAPGSTTTARSNVTWRVRTSDRWAVPSLTWTTWTAGGVSLSATVAVTAG